MTVYTLAKHNGLTDHLLRTGDCTEKKVQCIAGDIGCNAGRKGCEVLHEEMNFHCRYWRILEPDIENGI